MQPHDLTGNFNALRLNLRAFTEVLVYWNNTFIAIAIIWTHRIEPQFTVRGCSKKHVGG